MALHPPEQALAPAVEAEVGAGGMRRSEPQACAVTIVAHDIGSVRGMERQLTALVIGLRRLGHQVTVIARTCELPPDVDVAFRRVRGPSRPFLLAYPWFMIAGSLAVRKWRTGIVQATGAIVLNHVDVVAVHYCQQVGTATPSRDTWAFRTHIKLTGVMKRLGERLCFRVSRAAAFVCVSAGVAAEVREYYPQLAERTVTIYNGIDTDGFAPGLRHEDALALRAALGLDERRLVAAFVASEWERKGLGVLIEALALAPEWSLVVAGEGDEGRYRSLAEAFGVGSAVRWLGVTRDVQVVYELADAFVLPTSYETFSLVTFEAAASALAILATPVNGVRELIEDAHNGFLITADASVIAERLERLARDPELRKSLGQGAREAALAFGSERMVAEHHALYARLAGASTA
jgi:glycosyltransferase involved in cell wall biosynthesis